MTEKKTKKKSEKNTTKETETPVETVVYPITIAGNELRKELILTASKTNKGLIWLGGEEHTGTPLAPSEKITLPTNEAITALGEAGDWLYVAELAVIKPLSKTPEEESN